MNSIKALQIQHDADHAAAVEKKRAELAVEADRWEYKGVSGARAFMAGYELALRDAAARELALVPHGTDLAKSLESSIK